jgi:hypothetical protein
MINQQGIRQGLTQPPTANPTQVSARMHPKFVDQRRYGKSEYERNFHF